MIFSTGQAIFLQRSHLQSAVNLHDFALVVFRLKKSSTIFYLKTNENCTQWFSAFFMMREGKEEKEP